MNRVQVKEQELNTDFLARFVVGSGLVGRREPEQVLLLGDGKKSIGRVDFDEIDLPAFKPPTDGHFFDINNNSSEEVAKVFAEEALTADLRQRVTSSDLGTTINGRPTIDYSEYNIHSRAEAIATLRSFELAKEYEVVVWLSAEDGLKDLPKEQWKDSGRVYLDGRFNIYIPERKGGEVKLTGKHIPLSMNRFETLELGKRLIEMGGKTLGPVEEVEELRVQPIGIKLKPGEDWLAKMREMVPEFAEIWDYIEQGGDVRAEKELLKAVEAAKKAAGGDNAIFQREMARMGKLINMLGNHGSGYQDNGIRSIEVERVGSQYYVEPVYDRQGNLICPLCGVKVAESESVCSKCGINLRKNNG